MAVVEHQYGERPSDRMMAAIFLGMMPTEYQRMAMRSQSLGKQKGIPKCEELRDYVLSVSQQEGIKILMPQIVWTQGTRGMECGQWVTQVGAVV